MRRRESWRQRFVQVLANKPDLTRSRCAASSKPRANIVVFAFDEQTLPASREGGAAALEPARSAALTPWSRRFVPKDEAFVSIQLSQWTEAPAHMHISFNGKIHTTKQDVVAAGELRNRRQRQNVVPGIIVLDAGEKPLRA